MLSKKIMPWKLAVFARGGLILTFSILISISARAQRPLGCDISGFQQNVNWSQLTNAGVKFVWAKATEGTYYPNSTYPNSIFTGQESGARAAGVYIGAYHYARPYDDPNITGSDSADTEAAWFWSYAGNYVKNGGGYLVPMLDWEDTSATVANGFTVAQMSAWVNEWCLAVSNDAAAAGVVGVRPVVYTGTWYSYPTSTYPGLNSTVTVWPNWMSSYNGENPQTGGPTGSSPSPNGTYPWSSWQIWQYNDTNTSVANWTGGDVDVYTNTSFANFLQTFAVGGTNAPNFTINLGDVSVASGSSATFSVNASGQAPLAFRWYFNGTNIPSVTSSNYMIANVQLTNVGSYVVAISNSYANVPSSTAYLTVLSNAANAALSPSSMVNWWPAENTPVDIFGANDGTPYNLTYTNGEVGSAFHFNGSTSYLLVNNATELSGNWTACMWVNRQNATATSASLMGDGTYALKLEQYNTTREVGLTKSGAWDSVFTPNCIVPQNTWTHLAFVYNGSTVQLYSNAVLVSSSLTTNGVAVGLSNLPLPRGCIGGDLISGRLTDPMLGHLDEIQVFSRALTAAEIAAIYNAGSNGLVRAPQFTNVVAVGSGQIQLNLRGQTGKTFTLYSSTNLLGGWTSLGTISNPTGATNYTDSTTSSQQKFYRATQP
jgi:GH25 family lysozyme M1 (1,4-beta-N-acetylmuramidase)